MITKQIDRLLLETVRSLDNLPSQILIDIDPHDRQSLGERKQNLLQIASNEWVLLLDTDEVLTVDLTKDIRRVINDTHNNVDGYEVPYLNHLLGKPIYFGGETYRKIRFFKKKTAEITTSPVHEEVIVKGNVQVFNGKISHNSYRSINQIIVKFTRYAWQTAGEKRKEGERVTLKKLTMYGPHMVWARAIKEQGWRDGWRGIVLALCFGYMESLIYWFLLWRNLFKR